MTPKFVYDEEAMKRAIAAVENDGVSKRCAAKMYGVRRITLVDKLAGRTPRHRKMFHLPYLTKLEEDELVQ